MMLRPVVIGDDSIHRIRVRWGSFFNYQHSDLNFLSTIAFGEGGSTVIMHPLANLAKLLHKQDFRDLTASRWQKRNWIAWERCRSV
jgi:hypothetical protein